MKDIVDKLQDSLEYEFNLSFSERKQLLEEIKSIREANDVLNNMVRERQIKIDKAIDYVEKEVFYDGSYYTIEKLLEILKGE